MVTLPWTDDDPTVPFRRIDDLVSDGVPEPVGAGGASERILPPPPRECRDDETTRKQRRRSR